MWDVILILTTRFVIAVAVLYCVFKYWPRTELLEISIDKFDCPECKDPVPKIRILENTKQTLWGGWTCNNCGTEVDKYGSRIIHNKRMQTDPAWLGR